jgi:protein-S-isoprenylcysteine O-methyltransferase Ste14
MLARSDNSNTWLGPSSWTPVWIALVLFVVVVVVLVLVLGRRETRRREKP